MIVQFTSPNQGLNTPSASDHQPVEQWYMKENAILDRSPAPLDPGNSGFVVGINYGVPADAIRHA